MADLQPKKKKRKTLLWVILIGVVLFMVFLAVAIGGKKPVDEVYVETSTARTIISSVSESGVVEPVVEVKIAADVSGEVVALDVREGMEVKRGQVLVTIRPDNYESALEMAQASLSGSLASEQNAKAAVEQAYQRFLSDSVNFYRQDALFQKKVVTKMEWDAAKLQLDIARSAWRGSQSNLKSAKYQSEGRAASLKTAQSDLRKTTLFATMDGTITRQNVKTGERVVGTAQMAGTELFRIADLSKMQVLVKINENDIVHVKIGDTAHVEIDAFEGKTFKGKVTEIAYSASSSASVTGVSNDQITSFEVKVEIDPASYLNETSIMRGVAPHQSPFRPGMSAQVEIFTEVVENAVAVPIQAVTIRRIGEDDAEAPKEVVFVLGKDMKVLQKEVKTGIADDKYIELLSGLAKGEQVVSGPYKLLSKDLADGMKVVVVKEEDTKKESEEKAE